MAATEGHVLRIREVNGANLCNNHTSEYFLITRKVETMMTIVSFHDHVRKYVNLENLNLKVNHLIIIS